MAIPIPADSAPALTPSTYDPDLGQLLLLPLPADLVAVLSPQQPLEAAIGDTSGLGARVRGGVVQLFARRGLVAERLLAAGEIQPGGDVACPSWPVGRLLARATDSVSITVRSWTVALPAGVARGIPLDSIEALPSRDSAALAAAVTRVVSGAAEADSAGAFRGLPFTVLRAYRTRDVTPGFVLSVLVRRIPQEDRPLEERWLVVVDAPADSTGSWRLAWMERASGREEELIASEPLAVLEVGQPAHVSVVLGRDDGTGTSLALLERVRGRWRLRWESPIAGC